MCSVLLVTCCHSGRRFVQIGILEIGAYCFVNVYVKCVVYYLVYNAQCGVQCIVCNVQCGVLLIVCNVQCGVLCILCYVQCLVNCVQFVMCCVLCTVVKWWRYGNYITNETAAGYKLQEKLLSPYLNVLLSAEIIPEGLVKCRMVGRMLLQEHYHYYPKPTGLRKRETGILQIYLLAPQLK